MANVNSVSSNSYSSSIYGNRNILSGLATGMDTEAMIENSVSGYNTKISQLKQKQEKITWKQDAYRDIIDASNDLANKYASYTSKTNLNSSTFFGQSSITTQGANADKISASGKSSSNVSITSATLASAARYTYTPSDDSDNTLTASMTAANSLADPNSQFYTSKIAGGSLTLKVGDENKTISFGENDVYASDMDFLNGVKGKLKEAGVSDSVANNITFSGGKFNSGAELVSAGGSLETKFNAENKTLTLGSNDYRQNQTLTSYLQGASLDVTLNGVTKSISLAGTYNSREDIATQLNNRLKEAFGTDSAGTSLVSVSLNGDNLSFDYSKLGSNVVSVAANRALGIATPLTNYLDTSKSLKDLGVNSIPNGNLTINGVNVGNFTKDSTLQEIINAINTSDAGVNASYSAVTGQFSFTAKETGAAGKIDLGDDLARQLFGTDNPAAFQAGEDAIVNATVNGQKITMQRASNTFDIDGMSVTVKDKFDADTGAVTFKSNIDSDKIVDAVKSFITDYNSLMSKLHSAYRTQPLTNSSSSSGTFEPLTEKDKSDMSESAISAYEEKAKTGILFGDSDLSAMYNRLSNAFSPSELNAIGITSQFDLDSGASTLVLDEDKLRSVLESEPDKVKKAFVGEDGTNGAMATIRDTIKRYASTSYAGTGILVDKAGSKKNAASLLTNQLQKQYDQYSDQISRLQTKLSSQIDYYSRQFSLLEQMTNTMNNQSSMLTTLMGG